MGRGSCHDDGDVEMDGDSSSAAGNVVASVDDTTKEREAMEFLTMARRLVDQGKPSQALQAVVMATRTQGGDEAVFHFLNRARELYRSRLLASSAVDELASLFAECAIAEAQPLKVELSICSASGQSIEVDTRGPSILQESGRMQIVLDAYADGSSFICLQCGGVVSLQRKDEHYAYWCG
ncbi:hypothetical protein MLD38_024732 [Melastoma candidum]|uniref:Uncharacterized protein n=1 Tax=Melastoma candidum TaxID=119954 RepID=A0ACB9NTJ5_9MYRT|nr:hypothetical protein MLD38_024732 [Melastoma candidum]